LRIVHQRDPRRQGAGTAAQPRGERHQVRLDIDANGQRGLGPNSRPEHIKAVADASLKRLGTDRIDLSTRIASIPTWWLGPRVIVVNSWRQPGIRIWAPLFSVPCMDF
jgi:hypothetical protein